MLRKEYYKKVGDPANAAASNSFCNGRATASLLSLTSVEDPDDSNYKKPDLRKTHRLSGLTCRTKEKTRRLFKSKDATQEGDSDDEKTRISTDIDRDPAFNPSQLAKEKRFNSTSATNKTLGTIQSIGKGILHPKDAIKSKATKTTASQLSKPQRPFLSQEADLNFLQVHENLKQAESTDSSRRSTSDEELDSIVSTYKGRIKEMEAHRESLSVAWTTSRHVRRVRVVPKRHIEFPKKEYFLDRDKEDVLMRYKWLQWLGYVSLSSRHALGCLLMYQRICYITRKTLVLNMLMIWTTYRLTSTAPDFV